MSDQPRPSQVRVLGKSMYTLSAGWFLAIAWLWIAEIQQHMLRHGEPPPEYARATISGGILPVVLLGLTGFVIGRATGRAPAPLLERREWWQAFWWSLVPNALLFFAAWVMIQ